MRRSDDLGQALRAAAAGHHGQAHLRHAQPGVRGGDADVTAQRQLQPAAERVVLDAAMVGIGVSASLR